MQYALSVLWKIELYDVYTRFTETSIPFHKPGILLIHIWLCRVWQGVIGKLREFFIANSTFSPAKVLLLEHTKGRLPCIM